MLYLLHHAKNKIVSASYTAMILGSRSGEDANKACNKFRGGVQARQ
jgi:hypothetical protein